MNGAFNNLATSIMTLNSLVATKITGSGSSAVGSVPAFNNTLGTLLKGSALTDTGTIVSSAEPLSAILQTVLPGANTGFGTPGIISTVHGFTNGIVGAAINDLPASSGAFPTGVTGFGIIMPGSSANQVFGLYAEADLASPGIARAGEIDCMSYVAVGAPPGRICNGLLIGSGGTQFGDYGLIVGGAGGGVYATGDPAHWRWDTGIYVGQVNPVVGSNHGSTNTFGILVDADTVGPEVGERINGIVSSINLELFTSDTMSPNSTVFDVLDHADVTHFNVRQNGDFYTTGHFEPQPLTRPVVSSCGSGAALNAHATDQSGIVTAGSGTVTSCVITFGQVFNNIPACVITAEASSPMTVYQITAKSNSTFTVGNTANFAGSNFDYICIDEN
jgi:hypothetical protein